MPRDVRTHTRAKPGGGTTTVRHHTRRGDAKRKRGPNPGHAGKMFRRAFAHGRKGRKGKAAIFAGLCVVELVLWLTLNGTALIVMMIGALLIGLSMLLTK